LAIARPASKTAALRGKQSILFSCKSPFFCFFGGNAERFMTEFS